jgi:hypothetical protein
MRSDSRLLLSHAVAGRGSAPAPVGDGAGQGRPSGLPSPVALQLLDIPFVLPLKQLPERVDGHLPRWAYEVQYTLVGADRTRYDVRVSGDPSLGLPFGQDADVLLALFKILESEPGQHDLATGVFRTPSYQMICRALGKTPTGRRFREIRDALTRLAGVRIYSRVVIDKTALAARIAGGDGAAPEVPTASTARRDVTHEMRWLLEYRVTERVEERRPVARLGDGPAAAPAGAAELAEERQSQMWIQHLAINPFWVAQAVSGWAGWIDVERHARLKSPTARRLYQICAATAARQVAAPWQFAEDALAAACLLTTSATKKPTKVRQQLESAADELRDAGLVNVAGWQGGRRGPKTFEVHPAPLLQFADLLRGIGLTDPPDFRVQYAVLRHFGVTPARARALLVDHPAQVGEVLLRACHLEATDPGAIEKSWAGWIVHHVQASTSFRGEVDFQRWKTSALRALTAGDGGAPVRALPPGAPAADGARANGAPGEAGGLEGPAARLRARYPLPGEDPESAGPWRAALGVVLPTVSPFELYGLEVAVPIGFGRGDDGAETLGVWVHPNDDVAAHMLARAVPRLERALADACGRPIRVRVERRDDRAAAGGAGAP